MHISLLRSVLVGAALIATTTIATATTSATAATSPPTPTGQPTCLHGEAPIDVAVNVPTAIPDGFNPATASAAELSAYGLPPRPSGDATEWLHALTVALAVPSKPYYSYQCPKSVHSEPPAPSTTTSGSTVSPNATVGATLCHVPSQKWVALVDTKGCTGTFPSTSVVRDASNTYNDAEGYFPAVYATPEGSSGTITTVYNPWVGVGFGSGPSDQLVQAGIEGASSTGAYGYLFRPWIEVYPYNSAQYQTMPVSNILIGDSMYVEVWYSGQTADFWISDTNQSGNYISKSEPFTGSTGSTAEWVIEKNGSFNVPHWSNPYTFTGGETLKNGAWTCLGVSPHVAIDLYQTSSYTSSTELAYGIAFSDPGSYCNWPIDRTSNY
jgi:hypothetical protein